MKARLLFPLMVLLALSLGTTGCARKTTEERATEITDHLTKTLDLTDIQRRKLEIIRNDILNKRSEIFNRQMLDQTRLELTSQLRRARFDPADYEDFKNKSIKKYDDFYSFLGQKLEDFHSALSPPQREKLIQEIEKNRDKWFKD